ncbi:MAG: class I SAM-dependent methyltransferase [Candidatus Norongarragalinales archaeon]
MRVEAAFDSIASEWNSYRAAPSLVLQLFLPLLPKKSGLVVLDAGCGNGRNSIELARLQTVKRVIAVDVSVRMLFFARKRVKAVGLTKKIKFFKADFAKRLPLRAESVDAAFYLASLHHLRAVEQNRAFNEMRRVVKPNGFVFISVWNKAQRKFWRRREKQFFVPWTKRGGECVKRFHYFFGKRELEKLGAAHGFEVVDSFFESHGARAPEKEARNLCVVFRKRRFNTRE